MIKVIKGDITEIKADAIVNASDKQLSGGGGIDKAIHIAAGNKLKEELKDKKINTSEAIITSGYNLIAKYIIHTAGPICKSGIATEKSENELSQCYISCLEKAKETNIKSIVFPCISTGVYKFPKELAANIAVKAINEWLKNNKYDIDITFICFDDFSYSLYKKILE